MARTFVVIFTLLSFSACTTLQPLANTQPSTIRESVHAGDKVELVKNDGTQLNLRVESVGETAIVGMDGKTRHEVPLADIRSIGTRTMTTSDKVWTGVVAAVLVGGVIAAAAGGGGGGSGGGSGSGY